MHPLQVMPIPCSLNKYLLNVVCTRHISCGEEIAALDPSKHTLKDLHAQGIEPQLSWLSARHELSLVAMSRAGPVWRS